LFTIGHQRVFSLARWFSQIPADFHLLRGTWERLPESQDVFAYRTFTSYGSAFQQIQLTRWFLTLRPLRDLVCKRPDNTTNTTVASFSVSSGLGSFRFARHYSGNRYYFFFLGVLRYFNSPRLLFRAYEFSTEFPGITLGGLPHSEIAGSKVVSTYPTLIAGCHVLHRLLVPRHPSYALSNLTSKSLLTRIHVLPDLRRDSGASIRLRKNNTTIAIVSCQSRRVCSSGKRPENYWHRF
jgi:hypothetical protein